MRSFGATWSKCFRAAVVAAGHMWKAWVTQRVSILVTGYIRCLFWVIGSYCATWSKCLERQKHQVVLCGKQLKVKVPFVAYQSFKFILCKKTLSMLGECIYEAAIFCIPIYLPLLLWNSNSPKLCLSSDWTISLFSINTLNLSFPAVKLFAASHFGGICPILFPSGVGSLCEQEFSLCEREFSLWEPEFLLWELPTSVATGQCNRALMQQST